MKLYILILILTLLFDSYDGSVANLLLKWMTSLLLHLICLWPASMSTVVHILKIRRSHRSIFTIRVFIHGTMVFDNETVYQHFVT